MNIEELKYRIDSIIAADTAKVTIDEIKKQIKPLMRELNVLSVPINQENYIFRTTYINGDVKPKRLDQIIYPPKDKVNGYQRVNRPGNPVFYSSSSMKGAILEGRYLKNQKITISEWEVKPNEILLPINIGYTDMYQNQNLHPEIKKSYSTEDLNYNNLLMNFLSKLFSEEIETDQDHRYKISVAISESLSFNTESELDTIIQKTGYEKHKMIGAIDAILYPSIQSIVEKNITADNLAITRRAFDRKVKFVSVDFCEIEMISRSKFECKELDFANEIDQDGNILWKGRPGNYIIPKDCAVTIKKLSPNNYFISRKDGKKLYRN